MQLAFNDYRNGKNQQKINFESIEKAEDLKN